MECETGSAELQQEKEQEKERVTFLAGVGESSIVKRTSPPPRSNHVGKFNQKQANTALILDRLASL